MSKKMKHVGWVVISETTGGFAYSLIRKRRRLAFAAYNNFMVKRCGTRRILGYTKERMIGTASCVKVYVEVPDEQ